MTRLYLRIVMAIICTGYSVAVSAAAFGDNNNITPEHDGFPPVLYSCTCLTTVYIGADDTICDGDSVIIDAGPGFVQYQWQTGATTQSIVAKVGGYYSVSVTDSLGCTGQDTMHLSVISLPPDINLGPDTTICQGSLFVLNATNVYTDFLWQDGSTGQTDIISTSGVYWAIASIFCKTSTDSVNVFVQILPAVDLGSDTTICAGDTLVLDAGAGQTLYTWQDSSSTQLYNAFTTGGYSVTVTDSLGCTNQDFMTLTLVPIPSDVDLGNDTSFCVSNPLTLDAGSGYSSYLWQDGSTNQTFTVNASGNYSVTASVPCKTSIDNISVTINPLPQLNLGNDTVICSAGTFLLNAGPGYASYLWQYGSTDVTYPVNQSGTYWVSVIDVNSCKASDTIIVVMQTVPSVNLGPDGDLCPDKQELLDAGSINANYLWQDGSTTQTYLVTLEGTYAVTISNLCGIATDSLFLAACPDCICDLPNAFSPNGDNNNDVLYVLGSGFYNMHLVIYNRHGELMFETRDQAAGWDGRYKGVMQLSDVYYYYLEADCINGRNVMKKGDVTLLN
jgi:gliding motility-associated-like protein